MSRLYYTIGNMRSGKSTLCTEWAKNKPMRTIVNSDSIRLALTGKRYEPLAETQVFAIKHIMIRALLERGFDVMVDGTHSTEISIQRILEIDINAEEMPIITPLQECIERANKTNQPDLIPSIYRVHKNLCELGLYSADVIMSGIFLDIDYYPDGPLAKYLDTTRQLEANLKKIKQKVIDRNLYGKFGEANG